MFEKGRSTGTIRFTLRALNGARRAAVATDVTGWRPVEMMRRADGTFVRILPIPRGRCEYKFIVDGQWIVDPDNGSHAANAYGGFNSVARIPPAGRAETAEAMTARAGEA